MISLKVYITYLLYNCSYFLSPHFVLNWVQFVTLFFNPISNVQIRSHSYHGTYDRSEKSSSWVAIGVWHCCWQSVQWHTYDISWYGRSVFLRDSSKWWCGWALSSLHSVNMILPNLVSHSLVKITALLQLSRSQTKMFYILFIIIWYTSSWLKWNCLSNHNAYVSILRWLSFLSNQAGRQYCFRLFPFAGLSITIMKSDDSILKRLDAPTKAPAWPVGSEGELIWPAPTEAMYLEKPEWLIIWNGGSAFS